ncbi:MAG TPA: tetratricopeptide repeat protein [Thermoanaerobaculia bacterium]
MQSQNLRSGGVMAEWHVPEEWLRRFLKHVTSREETRRIVRHLLHGCSLCSALSQRLTAEQEATATVADYEQLFRDVELFGSRAAARHAVEKVRGWAQWAALEELPPAEREARVRPDERVHTHGFYKRLLDASLWRGRSEPAEAVDIVKLAILVAELVEPARVGGEPAKIDLQAAAWAILGNARRLASDFAGARAALDEAWRLNALGTREPLERAQLLSLEASWMISMGEFERAEALLEEAVLLHRAAGNLHQQGRVLLKMGVAIGYVQPERGIAHIENALTLIDRATEPRLDLCAQHALAHCLSEAGRPQQALAVLDAARPLYKQFSDDHTQLRLHWLEGRIARQLGHSAEAVDIFRQMREEFRVRDLHHETLLVSIDLAEAYVAAGEPELAARLVAELVPIIVRWGLHRDALSAWSILQDALELRRAEGLFGALQEYFRRHWVKPGTFEPGPLH